MERISVAIVSGGSSGIGRSVAHLFAERGVNVGVLSRRSGAELTALETSLPTREGQRHAAVTCDVRDAAAVRVAVRQLRDVLGPPDCAVAAAGVAHPAVLFRLRSAALADEWQVNVAGALHVARAATEWMLREQRGAVVFVGSVLGTQGAVGHVGYAASKAALHGVTASLAKELGPRGLRVNCVEPGYVPTTMTAALSEEERAAIAERTALRRWGTAEEIAEAVWFLGSASFVTGQVLAVDGGLQVG